MQQADEGEASAPVSTSVVAVLARDFVRQSVSEQARLKADLQAVVEKAIAPLPEAERVVLDVPEGLVIVVLGGPDEALQTAERAQAAAASLPLCVGINYGPVKPANSDGAPELLGDGIVAAVTLSKLATRGRLLASRSFRDALEALAPHRAAGLAPAGMFTDANVRTHELFTLDPAAATGRGRRVLILGALAVIAILGAGAGARMLRDAARRPALIQFNIAPEGELFVDGAPQGRTPPLTELEVAPGAHTIEVRNASHPPLKLSLTLKPGEQLNVNHSFPAARKAEPPARKARREKRVEKKEDSFVDQMRRKLGI